MLNEILESDYKFVLISGDYFDCPSCNDSTSFNTSTHYDEKDLIKHMIKFFGKDRMETIWVLDSYTGDMAKYSDIKTDTGYHRVTRLTVDLPSGRVIIAERDGIVRELTKAEQVLYESADK